MMGVGSGESQVATHLHTWASVRVALGGRLTRGDGGHLDPLTGIRLEAYPLGEAKTERLWTGTVSLGNMVKISARLITQCKSKSPASSPQLPKC
jgi:hypothetical protein